MSTTGLSVTEFLNLTNEMLVSLGDVAVEGEVSAYTVRQSKWIFFSLKDDESTLECFAMSFRINMPVEDGMRIRVRGLPSVYKKTGRFRIMVERVEPLGEGALKKAYELLKKKLESEGLFSAARKRPIPTYPKKIGLITSRDAAAYTDFLAILNQRWGGVEVMLCDVRVQGDEAPRDITDALEWCNALPRDERPDVLVLTRGGGSLEDLWAFNDESMARAIFASSIPIVCGIGHEKDESLADLCADVRATTPTNAAEIVVPHRTEIAERIHTMQYVMESSVEAALVRQRHGVATAINQLEQLLGRMIHRVHDRCMTWYGCIAHIAHKIDRHKSDIAGHIHHMERGVGHALERTLKSVQAHESVLNHVNPTGLLKRGYAIARDARGRIVRSIQKVNIDDRVAIQLSDGIITGRINDKTQT